MVEPVCLESWNGILDKVGRRIFAHGIGWDEDEAGTMYDCLMHTRYSVTGVGVGRK